MDQSGRFSDYFFAKMGPTLQNGDDDCTGETKERCHTPTDPAGVRKWISDNMMLLVTLSGVILGVVVGEYNKNYYCNWKKINKIFPGQK